MIRTVHPRTLKRVRITKQPEESCKLPELQDGISSSELAALRSLVEVYGSDVNAFDSAFRQMYQIGKPEVRKYCSPLQAVFWLAEKDVEEVKKQFEFYETESLLDAAWDFLENELTLSEKESKEVIASVKDKELRSKYYAFLDRPGTLSRLILVDYKKKPRVFSRKARKIIKSSLRREKNLRWRDFNVVVERLNAPELLDYYLRMSFTYNHVRVQPHANGGIVTIWQYSVCLCSEEQVIGNLEDLFTTIPVIKVTLEQAYGPRMVHICLWLILPT
ncbi:MAG: hypothetical protein GTN76_05000 [Candidatus Aenigmarchaeota archaeon]|nr:hypothetical protein [Candidatus Aenigmarchaeota archaeon]